MPIVYESNAQKLQKKFTPSVAWLKICAFCAYQERTHKEVRSKLYDYGLHESDVEILITRLLEENFLSEERFAVAFARGKAHLKGWGRHKIRFELIKKGVSKNNCKLGIKSIDDESYGQMIRKQAQAKAIQFSNKPHWQKKASVFQFLIQKGYESDLIEEVWKEMI